MAEVDGQLSVAQLQQQVADLQAQQVQSQLGTLQGGGSTTSDFTTQLGQLAQLREAGHLTQEEFNAAKVKILGT